MNDLKPLYNQRRKLLEVFSKEARKQKTSASKKSRGYSCGNRGIKANKLKYLNLFSEKIILKDELIEVRELTDAKINELQLKKTQLKRKNE
jgi:site-specific DNA recombinase